MSKQIRNIQDTGKTVSTRDRNNNPVNVRLFEYEQVETKNMFVTREDLLLRKTALQAEIANIDTLLQTVQE